MHLQAEKFFMNSLLSLIHIIGLYWVINLQIKIYILIKYIFLELKLYYIVTGVVANR